MMDVLEGSGRNLCSNLYINGPILRLRFYLKKNLLVRFWSNRYSGRDQTLNA